MKKSKTQQALEWLDKNPSKTPYAAALHAAVAPSAVYRALAARARPKCPHCGANIRQ